MFTTTHRAVFGGLLKPRTLTYTPSSRSRILLEKLLKFPPPLQQPDGPVHKEITAELVLENRWLLMYVRICSSLNGVIRNSVNTVTNRLSTVGNELETTCHEEPTENT